MRASTDQVRDLTLDVVDGARKRASGVVTHGAEVAASTLDGAAAIIGDGVERLSDRVPTVGVSVQRRPSHRLRTALLVTIGLVAVVAVARKLLGGGSGSTDQQAPTGPGDSSGTRTPLEDAQVGDVAVGG